MKETQHSKTLPFYILIFLICTSLVLKTLFFTESLNFSTDQGYFSHQAYDLWKAKEHTLPGPTASFNVQGRYLIQSSAIYYVLLLFLVPSNFDPVIASWLLTLFGCLMAIPLYVGAKKLMSRHNALLLVCMYCLFPFYVQYSRFLWNPNIQFILSPLLVVFLGHFREKRHRRSAFLCGFWASFLLLFHYQMVLGILVLTIYLIVGEKMSIKNSLMYFFGLIVGYAPMIAYELNSNFYNIRTVLLLLSNQGEAVGKTGSLQTYYFLTISFLLLSLFLSKKELPKKLSLVLSLGILCTSILFFTQKPSHAFGMVPDWNVIDEIKVVEIIRNEQQTNFAVVNLAYETKASVMYFLLHKENVQGSTSNYNENDALFIIGKPEDRARTQAYEVRNFEGIKPSKEWTINETYRLYLLEK